MEKTIRTLELQRWSEPDELHRVKFLGMVKAQVAFEKLKAHLEANNLLPDEYFLFKSENFNENSGELPEFSEAVCHTNFGGSEGIYLDILLRTKSRWVTFATGKTLKEDATAFYRMSRISAECSLLLNGCGSEFTIEEPPAITYRLNDKEQTFYTVIEKRGSDALLKRDIGSHDTDPTPYIVASNVRVANGYICWGNGRYCENVESAVKLFSECTLGYNINKQATLSDLLTETKQQQNTFSKELFENREHRKAQSNDLSL